jgi:hypothetical protein
VNVHRYTITVKGTPEKRIRKLEALAAEVLTLRDQGQGPLQESFLCSGYQIGSLFSPIKTGARPGYASINAS